MYRFLIVIEKANGNYSAYSLDLPGCAATGKTREQATRNMYEAIEMQFVVCSKMSCQFLNLVLSPSM